MHPTRHSPSIAPVIMCGGAGTRLWPASTEAWPKPFRAFGPGPTLFQSAVLRVKPGDDQPSFTPPIIVCGAAHLALVETQLADLGVEAGAIVLEPCARGTAALTAVAAGVVAAIHPGAAALLSPADHKISDRAGFRAAIARGVAVAAERIVTFGIQPDGPETGYGYVQAGEALAPGVKSVVRFVEKPDARTAQQYLEAGDYSWNAGIFLFPPDLMLAELGRLRPDIAEPAAAALKDAVREGVRVRLDEASFSTCANEAIDRAVMERTRHAAIVSCDIGWTDVGSWSELWRSTPRDDAGVATEGPVEIIDTQDSLIWSDGPPIAVLGMSDLVVVAAGGAFLVAPKSRAQEVKKLAEVMRAKQGTRT
jgi:mannose-1-phosphate guanylyltransferase/mannose-6-phosphate isomerase